MLRFYALYKQATLGKCSEPKPSFWAVIAKAKWDAWKCLGNMPKEEAMKKYVEGLKEVSRHYSIYYSTTLDCLLHATSVIKLSSSFLFSCSLSLFSFSF